MKSNYSNISGMTGRIYNTFTKSMSFCSWKCRLKNRHLKTKNDRLRLRYAFLILFFVGTGVAASVVKSHHQKAFDQYSMQLASIEPYAGPGMHNYSYNDQDLLGSIHKNFNIASALLGNRFQKHANDNSKDITVKSGDSIGLVLERAGVGASESKQIIDSMKDHFDPRKVRAGQTIALHFDHQDGEKVLNEFKLPLDKIKTLVVYRGDERFQSSIQEKAVKKVVRAQQAKIKVSLYGSAAKAGIPDAITAEAIRIYSWNTDFQRDIRQNDVLEVMYEAYETEDGHVAKYGDVLYARLQTRYSDIPLYRYEMANGMVDYFMPDGVSIKRTLMQTPVDGARISSGFGMRKHPILGYNKMHKGVDFAAPTGTPIYAAGDGVVERAGWASGYGKFVKIRHNSSLQTAYGHMSKIKVKAGQRVKQGQVIALVGSTGRSTGPHLHYEVLKNGKHVNPRSLKLPTGKELKGNDKRNFETIVRKLNRQFVASLEGRKIALKEYNSDDNS
ncbi:MAG: M23 family metallopeptidase [Pseudomonadota bacterium]